MVRKASWHCRQCHHDYYGEQYCTHCQTGGFSIPGQLRRKYANSELLYGE
ncbi:putative zinc ribbon protein [Shigella flexneri]